MTDQPQPYDVEDLGELDDTAEAIRDAMTTGPFADSSTELYAVTIVYPRDQAARILRTVVGPSELRHLSPDAVRRILRQYTEGLAGQPPAPTDLSHYVEHLEHLEAGPEALIKIGCRRCGERYDPTTENHQETCRG